MCKGGGTVKYYVHCERESKQKNRYFILFVKNSKSFASILEILKRRMLLFCVYI